MASSLRKLIIPETALLPIEKWSADNFPVPVSPALAKVKPLRPELPDAIPTPTRDFCGYYNDLYPEE